jgi:pyrimidine deaminase RibD-like protein
MEKMIDLAEKMATRSTQDRFKTGCVIFSKKGKIVSKGWSHVSEARLAEYWSIHAELHAVIRASHSKDLHGATAYIVTLSGKSGEKTMAQPCRACAAVLHAAGVKNVVFTFWDGSVQDMNLADTPESVFKRYRQNGELRQVA